MPLDPLDPLLKIAEAIDIDEVVLRRALRHRALLPAGAVKFLEESLVLARLRSTFVEQLTHPLDDGKCFIMQKIGHLQDYSTEPRLR